MSSYGRIWEEIAMVRKQILVLVPGVRTDSLDHAKGDTELHVAKLRGLIADWQELEKKADGT